MNAISHPSEAEYVFLDLDGTLSDPSIGITSGVMFTLERFGILETDREKLKAFIGPPLYGSFMKYFGFSLEDAYKAVAVFQEYYAPRGQYENTPYPGIREMLARWKNEGRKLILATSKPEVFAVAILERFGMADSFAFIAGGNEEETRVHKDEIIAYAKEQLALDDTIRAVMVGDTEYDVRGAAKHGIPTIGVTYGFGGAHVLKEAGAHWIAESVEKLDRLMQRNT